MTDEQVREHEVFPVPDGFPHDLDDETLEQWAATFAARLRAVTEKGVGYKNEGVVLGYGTMLDVARGECFAVICCARFRGASPANKERRAMLAELRANGAAVDAATGFRVLRLPDGYQLRSAATAEAGPRSLLPDAVDVVV
jgi:hypothetical protein